MSLDRFLATPATPGNAALPTVAARPSASSRTQSRLWRCRGRPSRPRSASSAPSRTTPPSRSGATATLCRLGFPAPCSRSATGCRPRRSRSMAPRARSSPPTALRRRAPGIIQRTPEHRAALEAAVLAAFTTARPCDRKANRPPGNESLAEAARLLGAEGRRSSSTSPATPSWSR